MAAGTSAGAAGTGPGDLGSATCWCCSDSYLEGDLIRLGDHPEVGVCFDCVLDLRRRARADNADVATRQLHAVANRVRDVVLARRLHERPVIGPTLIWINRHLPW